jgi:hypothetical protein
MEIGDQGWGLRSEVKRSEAKRSGVKGLEIGVGVGYIAFHKGIIAKSQTFKGKHRV